MPAFKDLKEKKFANWFVISWAKKEYGEQFWLCECICGTKKVIIGSTLKCGRSKSCGCKGKDWCRRHGMEGTLTYSTWGSMKARCNNPSSNLYANYGGRGIKLSESWMDFVNFYADMGKKPKGKSIDRIDADGDYCKENCRWASTKEQGRNKRNTIYLEYKGQRKPMAEWAEIKGLKRKLLENRIRIGWSVEDALETPTRSKK